MYPPRGNHHVATATFFNKVCYGRDGAVEKSRMCVCVEWVLICRNHRVIAT